ncbi:dihydropteroate synthase [Sandaracinus amylolyticus]|uniref:dihydropteroate synthase n=1 Tax=Sandaracinus amylolyticus TaxID=927083 RepID=UPI001F030068|nr:dihydropteroate synthase [Sandaracinus amylolyticus]UJR79795.1 Dihydropteroate synthase [Sandaracinus amylolyticus]
MSAPVEIWGVLNVTPDSFSDGGRFVALDAAIEHAERMRAEGADVIDVGGASSRPPGKTYGAGAPDIAPSEEIARVAPVIEALVARGMRVSIDTARGEVADAALARGASIVNDVTMGADDALLDAVARHGAELVLMHSRGGGRVDATTTAYRDVVDDVLAELRGAITRAVSRGVRAERIWIDPGVGFAKTPAQSAALIGATSRFVASGHRVLVGASRKSFIGQLAPDASGSAPAPDARLGGSIAAITAAVLGGAHAVRVHDVAVSRQAALVALAMRAPRNASRGKEARADA